MEDAGWLFGNVQGSKISRSFWRTLDAVFAEWSQMQRLVEESVSTRASGIGVVSAWVTRAGRRDQIAADVR